MAAATAGGGWTRTCVWLQKIHPEHIEQPHPGSIWWFYWRRFSFPSFCGIYVGYHTVFRVDHRSPEVEFRCTSPNSVQPFQASYSSYNISHRKHCRARTWASHKIWNKTVFFALYILKHVHSSACPDSYFLCTTGLCVERSRLCDGLDDCQDESDELFCCKLVYKLHNVWIVSLIGIGWIKSPTISMLHVSTARPAKNCGSSGPPHPLLVCNGEKDCSHGEDEINCTQGVLHPLPHFKAGILSFNVNTLRQKRLAPRYGISAAVDPASRRRTQSVMMFLTVRTTVTRPTVVSPGFNHSRNLIFLMIFITKCPRLLVFSASPLSMWSPLPAKESRLIYRPPACCGWN